MHPWFLPGPPAAPRRRPRSAGRWMPRQAGGARSAGGPPAPLPPAAPPPPRPEHRPDLCPPLPSPAADEEVMHVGRRVYVSNLAWRTSWQDLKDK